MFSKIMVPVDLAHLADLEKALTCARDLAGHYGAEISFVGVTAPSPGALAHNPAEYEARLAEFAAEQGAKGGANAARIKTRAHMVISHDPKIDLDETLLRAAKEVAADLVVMASHLPKLTDYLWPSNGGKVAAHASASVMVVRP